MIVQIDVVLNQPDLQEQVKGRMDVSRWRGACQKAFNAKVREIDKREAVKIIC